MTWREDLDSVRDDQPSFGSGPTLVAIARLRARLERADRIEEAAVGHGCFATAETTDRDGTAYCPLCAALASSPDREGEASDDDA